MFIFQSIANKLRRVVNRFSFARKNRAQHKLVNKEEKKFGQNEASNKSLIPWLHINYSLIFKILLLFVFLGAVYQSIRTIDALVKFQPQKYVSDQQQTVVLPTGPEWQGNTKLNIVVVGTDKIDPDHIFIDALGIYNWDPIENKMTVFMINPDLKVYVASLGMDVNFRTLFTDSKLKGDRTDILKRAVAAVLALRIDRYIIVDKADFAKFTVLLGPVNLNLNKAVADPDTVNLPAKKYISWPKGTTSISGDSFLEFIASDSNGRDDQLERQQNFFAALPFAEFNLSMFFKIPDLVTSFGKYFYTDLSKSEIILLTEKFTNVKEDTVKKGYTRSDSYIKTASASFYPVFNVDVAQIDQDINNIFFDLKIFKEHARIEMLNTSNIKGLANSRARWLTNLGARIIKVGNGIGNKDQTTIYCAHPELFPNTLSEMERIFNFKSKLVKEEYPNRHIGDIIVELGNTYE